MPSGTCVGNLNFYAPGPNSNVPVGAWGVLMAPKSTSSTIIGTLNKAAALAEPEVRGGFLKQSFHPAPMAPQETAAFLRAGYEKWGKMVREANIKVN
jgi:tripartite-type tricarboxylate transporter receptor subunit TctC